MMVTSDSTALMAMRTVTKTGNWTLMKPLAAGDVTAGPRPTTLPSTTNTSTGIPIVVNAPSGSRRKILISSHVRFHSPRNIVLQSNAPFPQAVGLPRHEDTKITKTHEKKESINHRHRGTEGDSADRPAAQAGWRGRIEPGDEPGEGRSGSSSVRSGRARRYAAPAEC